jgi:2-dehydropantoate 2-reductase
MKKQKMAIIGPGATGTVLAAALLGKYPDTPLVGRNPEVGKTLMTKGVHVFGTFSFNTCLKKYISRIGDLKEYSPDILFISSKTFHLDSIIKDLEDVYQPGMKIVATHNGLGVEDLIADKFGRESVFRMSLNFGVTLKHPGVVEAAFFNSPNHLGGLTDKNRAPGMEIAQILTDCGLETVYVDDIKLFVWKKMVMKCTMANICAITNKTIKEALSFAPTREIADACFQEALAVARAMGYAVDEAFLTKALAYLEKAGVHRDSMSYDIENKTPTEIDFLSGKIVDYGRQKGIPTPFLLTMTHLVKAMEDEYLEP